MTKHFQPPSGGTPTRAYRRREKSHKGFERRRPLDRAAKGRILRYLGAHTRWQPGGRAITHLHVRIIRIVLFEYHNAQNGRCDPSQQTIAEMACCDADTVREALHRAEKLGVVSWCHRWFRGRVDGLQRVFRSSNGYIFMVPDAIPRSLSARRILAPNDHKPTNSGGTQKREYSSLKPSLVTLCEPSEIRAYLADGRLNPKLVAACDDRKPPSSASDRWRRFAPLLDDDEGDDGASPGSQTCSS